MAITAHHLSYQHENRCALSWSKVPQVSTRTLSISKKHVRLWPMKFEHILDKVNRGRSEQTWMAKTWFLRSVRDLKEIGHWGVWYCIFQGHKRLYIASLFAHMHNIHMIEILILDNFNFASRTTAVNQIKSFVKNKKKLLLQTSPIGFSLNLGKKQLQYDSLDSLGQ